MELLEPNQCVQAYFKNFQSSKSSDINVKACGCDSLYRTITKFSFFCCFRAMTVKLFYHISLTNDRRSLLDLYAFTNVFKFLVQPFPRYGGGPKILKVGKITWPLPHSLTYFICFVSTLQANLHSKFEISSFNSSRDTYIYTESQNSQSRSHDLLPAPFDPILHFSLVPLVININRAKFVVSSFNHSRYMEDWRGSHNSKSRSRDPFTTAFDGE